LPFWWLDLCGARPSERRNDQATKDSDCLSARNVIGSSEQRNKWQGPARGGKDAVYAGYELEPMEWSATDVRVALVGFSRLAFSFLFAPPPVLQVQSFGFHNVCCPNASFCWCSV
jgi:hypothetical protein